MRGPRSSNAGAQVGSGGPRGAAPRGWTPRRAANGSIWLRADLGISLATGAAAWADQLGIQSAAAQATALQQPTVSSNAVNGQPAVSGNGGQFLLSSFTPPSTDAEMWVVLKCGSGNGAMIDAGGGANQSAYPFGAAIFDRFATTARKDSIVPVVTLTNWHVYSVQSASGLWRCWQNGTQAYTTGTNTVGWGTTMGVLSRDNGTLIASSGSAIAELWIGRIMSTADRARTRTYINERYGNLVTGVDWV